MIRVIVFLVMFFGFCVGVNAGGRSSLIVFGDSLLDVGNDYIKTTREGGIIPIPPETRYFNRRFSNGLNVADYLWDYIGDGSSVKPSEGVDLGMNWRLIFNKQAVSFAYGGAESGVLNSVVGKFEVLGLLGQVGFFRVLKPDNTPMRNTYALVWSGANDYINEILSGRPVSEDDVILRIKLSIIGLYHAGVRQFLIPNLPDLGEVPLASILAGLYLNADIPDILTDSSMRHNEKLRKMFKELKSNYPIRIMEVDVFGLVKKYASGQNLVAGPAAGCLFSPVIGLEVCNKVDFGLGDDLIYWDELHPTTVLHKAIADKMIKLISQ